MNRISKRELLDGALRVELERQRDAKTAPLSKLDAFNRGALAAAKVLGHQATDEPCSPEQSKVFVRCSVGGPLHRELLSAHVEFVPMRIGSGDYLVVAAEGDLETAEFGCFPAASVEPT